MAPFTALSTLVALALLAVVPAPAVSAHALAERSDVHHGLVLRAADHSALARRATKSKKKCPNRAGTTPPSLVSATSATVSTTTSLSTSTHPTTSSSATNDAPKPTASPATHDSPQPKPKPTTTSKAFISTSTSTTTTEKETPTTEKETPKPTTVKTTPKPKPTATSRPIPARSSKIGLPFVGNVPGAFTKAAKATNHKLFATYNWGPNKLDEVANSGIPFIPMFWGEKSADDWSQVKRGYATMALGCNEVNQPGQSEMSVSEGIRIWRKYLAPLSDQGYTLFSHSTSNAQDGIPWMEDFRDQCDDCWKQTAAVAIHYYSNNAQGMIDYLVDAHNRLQKPLIITEFGCVDFSGKNQQCNEGEVEAFIKTTTSFMDKQSWVVAYFYFGSFTASDPSGGVPGSSALFNNDGTFTDVGRVYVS
ncbi:hypothetical protein EXIGLDRAFT_699224 [Exidia glandulosa HHB12029]|uniref:Asl1-like glycosyl hydrolase catalytic domain-containing protein n=1 Tax=Exidia glandulosa HHB12029 TaxID=1314781 RepID=A0A165QB94_EXIGL|nr:hypothetical protein EXIGLDRAFT_699224 [Exidia glandulosa HHB12029]